VAGAIAGGVGAALVGAITEVFAGAVAVVVAAGVGGGGGGGGSLHVDLLCPCSPHRLQPCFIPFLFNIPGCLSNSPSLFLLFLAFLVVS
jgi:hypothetical protein